MLVSTPEAATPEQRLLLATIFVSVIAELESENGQSVHKLRERGQVRRGRREAPP